MKILLYEIKRIFLKAPCKILFIWILDIIEAVFLSINPYLIGQCIDNLLNGKWFGFILLIFLELLYLTLHTVNIYFDTRIYIPIIENERILYYSHIINTNMEDSVILTRLDFVDDIPNFLESDLLNIIRNWGEIIAALLFILLNSNPTIFIFATIYTIAIPVATHNTQKKIINNNISIKNLEEDKLNQISNKDNASYSLYMKKISAKIVNNSDQDTKLSFIAKLFQIILLITTVFSLSNIQNATSGIIFSGIIFSTTTYVLMLNDNVTNIYDHYILVEDLIDTAKRLKENP